jgi:hypothetical protein
MTMATNTAATDRLGAGRGSGEAGSKRPSLPLRIKVRTHHSSLDRRLAEGERPDHDAALELRARQLTSDRLRRGLARSLMRALHSAQEPRRWGSAAPVDRRAVTDARLQLIELALRLEQPDPVAARGIAMISELLTDGGSPLYAPGWTSDRGGNELRTRLYSAAAALERVY